MAELGKRYAAEPALGWVDVGGYGAWGEWHNANQGSEISVDARPAASCRPCSAASRPST